MNLPTANAARLQHPRWGGKAPNTLSPALQGMPKLVIYARVIAWAVEQREFPTAAQVVDRFGCHIATAHRWLNAIEEAYGVERPRQSLGRPSEPRAPR